MSDERSPEEIFAAWGGAPEGAAQVITPIHLVSMDEFRRVTAIKGVRAVLASVRSEKVDLTEAAELVTRFEAGERPLHIADARNPIRAKQAADEGYKASGRLATFATGLDADEVEEAQQEARMVAPEDFDAPEGEELPAGAPNEPLADTRAPDDWAPSVAACKIALNLLASYNGSTQMAYTWARIMGGNDPEAELWQDIVWLFASAFPTELRKLA